MKQYFKHLCMALTGNNPYEAELSELRSQYERAAAHVMSLQEMYYKSIEAYDAVKKHVAELEQQNARMARQLEEANKKS